MQGRGSGDPLRRAARQGPPRQCRPRRKRYRARGTKAISSTCRYPQGAEPLGNPRPEFAAPGSRPRRLEGRRGSHPFSSSRCTPFRRRTPTPRRSSDSVIHPISERRVIAQVPDSSDTPEKVVYATVCVTLRDRLRPPLLSACNVDTLMPVARDVCQGSRRSQATASTLP